MRRLIVLFGFIFLMVGAAFGEKLPIVLNKTPIDHTQYHPLVTSNVMFNSIKGKQLLITISFKDEDYDRYFRNNPLQPPLMGKVVIHSTQGPVQVFTLFFTQDFKGMTNIISVDGWSSLTSRVLFDENTLKLVKPRRGQYVLFPEIYIPKEVPADMVHVIGVMELDQLK